MLPIYPAFGVKLSIMERYTYLHLPHSQWQKAVLAGLGTALAIGLLGYFSATTTFIMLVAPFGASCVLMFGMPTSPVSQPINVVGGHIFSAVIGLALHFMFPDSFVAEGMAVGLAVAGMMLLRIVHPPAGATALVAYLTATSWWFLVFPVMVGSVTLVVIAALYHRLTKTTYPHPVPEA
jgi:CBS-domain-containing membrane protein